MTRKALGRGLSALLPEKKYSEEDLLEVDIDLITPNSHQPRTLFDEKKLQELVQSIRINGIVQPILLRRQGNEYQIVAGERRWRAAQQAGLLKIPAIIRNIPNEKLLELALIENIQREELNPIEEAQAYQRLIDEFSLNQDELARRVGKERSTVTNMLRLLRLSPEVQRYIERGELSTGHGRALLGLIDNNLQLKLAEIIITKGLSVRETERQVKKIIAGEPIESSTPKNIDPNLKAAEVKLQHAFNTKVRIQPGAKGGRIEIEYYSNEDLDRLYSCLIGKESKESYAKTV